MNQPSQQKAFTGKQLRRASILMAAAVGAVASTAQAVDESPAVFLQFFEAGYKTIENRTPDVFMAGYGAVWTPPPGRSDQGPFSVGYDVYDRFDLGTGANKTLYGTETGIKTMANGLHRAGLDFHVDFVMNHNGYSGTGDAGSREAFKNAGGYPGFFTEFFGDVDGDFNSAYSYGDVQGRLAGLIDIAHNKNYTAVRNPVPGFANNIGAGTTPWNGRLANVPDENNRRFYPDIGHNTIFVFDPITGEQNIPVHSFNAANPMAGDPTQENALGYLMRNAQWLVQVVGVDGLRIDAGKHMDGFVLDYFDRAVYRSNPRNLLNGAPKHVFSYSEVYDANPAVLLPHVKKNINPNDPGRIGGNRDTLDFKLYFAMKDNLEHYGQANAWYNVKDADLDFANDGLHNGSHGVKFVNNHDVFKPFKLDNVAHAYVLMMPGNATVYFNGKEFGDDRDFPKEGRGDALSVGGGSQVTRLLDIRTTHGRGNYQERWVDNEGLFVFERESSAVVGLSNRGDGGFDQRKVQVAFAPGTHLLELSGNASNSSVDPFNDIHEVLTVYHDNGANYIDIRVPRNLNANGQEHQRGYVVYGLATPQSANGLELTNVAMTLAGDSTPTNNFENGTQRQTDVSVIKANSFQVRLMTNEVRLLGSDALRDIWADGDNAMLKMDGGRDLNGNGFIDVTAPGNVAYGFEQFGTKSSPLIGPGGVNDIPGRGDGEFLQTIDTTQLAEGYHYLNARAFRHRIDGGPAVFSEFKKVIYVDRLKPVSVYDSNKPITIGNVTQNENRDFFFRSTDQTANSMHVFRDLPATMTEAEILAMVGGGNQADSYDRDLFKKYFDGLENGNHVFTVVTYEMTGTYNVQRFAGVNTTSIIGRGLGDTNFNGQFDVGDIAGTNHFEDVYYSRNTKFNPAADINGDGLVDGKDLLALKGTLMAGSADGSTMGELTAMLGRRADLSGDFGPNWFDIDLQRNVLLGNIASTDLWKNDINSDGVLNSQDFDAMINGLFQTEHGDIDLNRTINVNDLRTLLAHYGEAGGWDQGSVNMDFNVDLADLNLLLSNYDDPNRFNLGYHENLDSSALALLESYGFTAVPEPGGVAVLVGAGLASLRRTRRSRRKAH